jgi:peptide-methionine (S)-S-oxide reductase
MKNAILAAILISVGVSAAAQMKPDTVAATGGKTLATATFAGGVSGASGRLRQDRRRDLDDLRLYQAGPRPDHRSSAGTGHTGPSDRFRPARVSYRGWSIASGRRSTRCQDQQFATSVRAVPHRDLLSTSSSGRTPRREGAIEKSKPFKQPIVTEITMATKFYPAEDYHQDYYQKNPIRYRYYRTGCGRDARLKQLWGDKAGH